MADNRHSVYCNICKTVRTDVHPNQNLICASCNEELKFREGGIKMITVAEWGEGIVIVKYKPLPVED